jgi:serine/threonine-protein kinase
MAPEQARGELHRVDARTDVHGVGATLYYAITGKAPYAGPDTPARVDATRRGIVQPPGERVAGRYLPAGLCAIAMKALAAEPADRYPSMVALRDALHRFLAGGWWFAPEHFAAGSVVVREGDAGGAAYIVESGTAEVRCRGEFIRRIGPGDVFGETAVLTAGTRTATVTAITDVDVLVVSREALEAELGRDTWLARFVRTLAVRFRELHERHYPVP